MKRKIAIITINYNNLVGLQTTLNSVAAQTYQDFEHIIIDGGSTDGSADYIKSQAHRFVYWVSETDKGVYHAMNKGIAKASGEYLLFLNSGDHFFNNTVLEKNIHHVSNYDLIYFNMFISGENKNFLKEYPATLSFAYFLKDNLPHPSIFIKKDLFKTVGYFDDNLKIVADWKFFIDSICRFNASYLHVDKTLTTFYFDGISSLPKNKGIIDHEKDQVLKSNYVAYMQDLDDVLKNLTIIHNLRRSRIIQMLIKLGFLNKF
ncbi:glycosyltransferase family 2 protein [Flavobacterium algicola]|uniref:glycosyltransferase family 2 protein n=1 Tax=Flavobacterium algicola TaxID=556529 RepID=UPI001EFD5689|nr:glycosyltransferase family 2 protein [Flavobacterium algicola]MCG9793902.1 glycosyltransferase [Flavobacterium algicola]